MALAIAFWSWPLSSVDMGTFLLPWFAHIRETGALGAFAVPFSNYTPPYLYLLALAQPLGESTSAFDAIKTVSFVGHMLLLASVFRLLQAAGHRQPWRAAALIAVAPTLFVNPAVLAQCDAYWAAAVTMALAAAVHRRHLAMFAWCGLAVALKAQAAFVAPFFLALAIARHVPIRMWLVAPLTAALCMVPAWLAGWPAADLLTIYLRQTQWESALALNAPNVWMLIQTLGGGSTAALGAAATGGAIIASAAFVGVFARRLDTVDAEHLLRIALLCTLIVPGLLPRMHERYFFLGDVLALVLVAIRPADWRLGLLTQAGSGLAILAYMTGLAGLACVGAAAMILATWFLARSISPIWQAAARSSNVAISA